MCADARRAARRARHTSAEARHLVLEIGAMAVSNLPGDRFTIHALGSCLGIAVYDPVARVGGLLHAALPLSTSDRARARREPGAFVDTGVPALFRKCYALGARKDRMQLTVAGGSAAADPPADDEFQIGHRNLVVFRKLLWKNGVLVHAQDVGGVRTWRTLSLDIATGAVTLKVNGIEREPSVRRWEAP